MDKQVAELTTEPKDAQALTTTEGKNAITALKEQLDESAGKLTALAGQQDAKGQEANLKNAAHLTKQLSEQQTGMDKQVAELTNELKDAQALLTTTTEGKDAEITALKEQLKSPLANSPHSPDNLKTPKGRKPALQKQRLTSQKQLSEQQTGMDKQVAELTNELKDARPCSPPPPKARTQKLPRSKSC